MTPGTLYRLGAVTFIVSGLLNIVVGILPSNPAILPKLLNLLGAAGGLLGLIAVYLHQRVETGVLGGISYILAATGLIGICGFLFTDAFVFSYMSSDQQAILLNGPTGMAIFGSVVLYVLGVVLFGAVTIWANKYPRIAAALYIIGTLPTLIALLLPPVVLNITESIASIGVIWIGTTLWRAVAQSAATKTPIITPG